MPLDDEQLERAFENIKTAHSLSKGIKDILLKAMILIVYAHVLKELGDIEAEKKMDELEDLIKHIEIHPYLI